MHYDYRASPETEELTCAAQGLWQQSFHGGNLAPSLVLSSLVTKQMWYIETY